MATEAELLRHTWPCERRDTLSIADFQRLAGKPHQYPDLPPEPRRCARCGNALTNPAATYCSPECVRRSPPRVGRYREDLQTVAECSYAPPKAR